MGTFYFWGLVSIVMIIFLIKHSIKVKEAERLKHKLKREDWILHELTACRED